VHSNSGVGGTGATADERNTRFARESAICNRHVAGTALMTTGHDIDLREINKGI
jgi:hypothetical protein